MVMYVSQTKTKEKNQAAIIYTDSIGQIVRLGDRVRHPKTRIEGTVIYGYHSVGSDEWEVQYMTFGYFVLFEDDSGTCGLTVDWVRVDEED